jgi:hypothetical protein
MEFLNALKFALMMFTDPWIIIPAVCVGVIASVIIMLGLIKEAKLQHKTRDPLDWIDDDFSL